MGIKHGILGPKRNASSTYRQELNKSKKALENIFKGKNEQEIKYVLSVAELKAKGRDLSLVSLKKLLNKAMLKEEVVIKKMRLVNLYLNRLMPEQAKRFILKNLNKKKEKNNAA